MKKTIILFSFLVYSILSHCQNEFVLAENYYRNSEYEKALQLYQKLTNRSPYNTTYLKRLVSCYQETNQFIKAEHLLQEKLKRNSGLMYFNVLLGYNHERQQQKDNAEKYYKKALNSITKQNGYGGVVANLFKEYNKLDLALEAYNKVSALNPQANYGFQIAQIYGEKGNFEKMFDAYIDLVDKNENYLHTVKRFASKYVTDDKENENNILFKKALLRKSISNPKPIWNNLLSWFFTKQKDYGKAFIQQKALFSRDSDNLSSIFELGKIAFKNKNYEASKACLNFVVDKTNYPRDRIEAIVYQIKMALETNQPTIEQQFEEAFKEYGKNENTLLLQIVYARYLTFKKNNTARAKEVLKDAIRFSRDKFSTARIKLQLGNVCVFDGAFNKARIYFSQVQTKLKNHPLGQQARFKVAQASYFKNDFKWAMAQLKVLKGSATQLIANDAAELFLTISDNQSKDSVSTGLTEYAKADLLAYQKRNEEAIVLLYSVLEKYKGQSIEDEALYKQAKLFIKQKYYTKAVINYEKIIDLDKEGILVDNSIYALAELYNNELNDSKKALDYYQKIIFEYPSSIYLVDARKKYRKLRGDNIN